MLEQVFGAIGLRRWWRRTRTQILILHEKGVISLDYVGYWFALVISLSLTFCISWTFIFPPETGFEHFPKQLLPDSDVFNRTHYHVAFINCESVEESINNLRSFITKHSFEDKAIHFYPFVRDSKYFQLTTALDEMIYSLDADTFNQIKFTIQNDRLSEKHDCDVRLALTPFFLKIQSKHKPKYLFVLKSFDNLKLENAKKVSSAVIITDFGYILDMELLKNPNYNDMKIIDHLLQSSWQSGTQILQTIFHEAIKFQ